MYFITLSFMVHKVFMFYIKEVLKFKHPALGHRVSYYLYVVMLPKLNKTMHLFSMKLLCNRIRDQKM
jgi:hypothetical protein